MNKLKTVVGMLLLLTSTTFYAQRKPDREKIKALKIAYITEKLDLSSKEAEVFWPLYNTYEEALNTVRKKERSQRMQKEEDMAAVSDTEAKEYIRLALQYKEEKHRLETNFLKKLTKEISAKKTMLLMKAEQGFKRHLIKQYHKKRGEGHR